MNKKKITTKDEKKKSILSRRGYTIRKEKYSPRVIHKIRKDLMVKPKTLTQFNQHVSPFPIFLESIHKLYIPKYYGLKELGEPQEINIDSGDDISLEFKGSLRSEQQPIAEKFIEAAHDTGGGLISLRCGGGKTVLAIYCACVLKKKTLVVVHKEFLLNQWKERISQFAPDAEIGIIKQNKVNITGKDIVLAMLQSISIKDYPDDTFSSFGFTIIDECHHIGAEVFSRALPKITTKYMLGLSATPKRKDGLSKVFEWYLGDMVYITKEKEKDVVNVELIEYYNDDLKYCKDEIMYNGNRCTSRMITNICLFEPRTKIIIDKITDLVSDNRKVLVLSDRREHLTNIKNEIDKNDVCSTGFYLGGCKQDELKESEEKDLILGTFSMASEGMDIPALDTIILASPKTDVEQAVGRILRKKKQDRIKTPLIIDIVDKFATFVNQSKKRKTFYKKKGYHMETIDLSSNNNEKSTSDDYKNLMFIEDD
jgi:superfamily II DNA or RNA helicase